MNYHYYKGSIYQNLKKPELAFYHLKKADSIYESNSDDIVIEVRDIQERLINYYKYKGDIENQLKYINRYMFVDSIIDSYRKNIGEKIHQDFYEAQLIEEKNQLLLVLQKNSDTSKKNRFFLLIIIGVCLTIVVMYYQKQRAYKTKLEALVSHRNLQPINTTQEYSSKELSDEVMAGVLEKLDKFEKNHGYTDSSLTLASTAKKIGTNSSYLSKTINSVKQKKFNEYLIELRLEYCIERLISDDFFRKYTIQAIAKECGFRSAETFSKSFHKKTGLYPSYFIKNI